jgi:hypothetical protein
MLFPLLMILRGIVRGFALWEDSVDVQFQKMPAACALPVSLYLAEPVTELDPSSSSILQSAPVGLPRTCEFIDSYLQVSSNDSELCQSTRETYQLECVGR